LNIRWILKFLSIIIFILTWNYCQAQVDGKSLVDKLYTVDGQLPIKDLVGDAEVLMPVSQSKKSTTSQPAMVLTFKSKFFLKKPDKLKIVTFFVDPGNPMDGNIISEYRDGRNHYFYSITGQFPHNRGADKQIATMKIPPNLQTFRIDANREHIVTGTEIINGINTTVVRIEGLAGDATILWIDPIKRVPLKMQRLQSVSSPSGENKVTTQTCHYGDFRQLKDGRWFPFKIEIRKDGAIQMLMVYKSLSVNVGIGDEIFLPLNNVTR
jgi:hypothetical protein